MNRLNYTDDEATCPTNQMIERDPHSRPISHEQLAAEVKGIYASLGMVEQKCIQIIHGSRKARAEDKPEKHWQALIALHRTLLYEHHEFLLASQHPSASRGLRVSASKYGIPARMWKHEIHSFLELLRHSLPTSREYMLAFLNITYRVVSLLYETVPIFQQTWIECLGDLSRYRTAIEETVEDQEIWTKVSRRWYCKIANRRPSTGHMYQHLANLQHLMLRPCVFTGRSPPSCTGGSPNAIADRDQQFWIDTDHSAIEDSPLNVTCWDLNRFTTILGRILKGVLAASMALFYFTGPKLHCKRLYSIRIRHCAGQLFLPNCLLFKITVVLLLVNPAAAWPGEEHLTTQLDQLQAVFGTVSVAAFGLCVMGVSAVSATIMGGGSLFWIVLVQSKEATRTSLITTFVIWFSSNLVYVLNHWRVLRRNDPSYARPRFIPWSLPPTFLLATTMGAFVLLWMTKILSPDMASMPMPVGALIPFCICLSSWFSSWLGFRPRKNGSPSEAEDDTGPEVGDEGV